MGQAYIEERELTDIANAIRSTFKSSNLYTPAEMAIVISTQEPGKWVRPNTWPDYSLISDLDGWTYLTYDLNINSSGSIYSFVSLYFEGCSVTVERGTLSNGSFTVATSTTVATKNYFRESLPTNVGRYIVYRFKPQATLTKFLFGNSAALIGTSVLPGVYQPCVEFYGSVNLTNMAGDANTSNTTIFMKSYRNHGTIAPTTMSYAFGNGWLIENIDTPYLDTSNCTTFAYAFYCCKLLTSVSKCKITVTAKCTSIAYTFGNCYALREVDTSDWIVTNVTNFSYAFYCCYVLRKIDTSTWNTSKGTTFSATF